MQIGMQISIDDYPGGPVLGTRRAEATGLLKPGSGRGSGSEGRRAENRQ